MCDSLINLNLENNIIEDEENLHFLSSLQNLKKLNLNNNPINSNPQIKNIIFKCFPHTDTTYNNNINTHTIDQK